MSIVAGGSVTPPVTPPVVPPVIVPPSNGKRFKYTFHAPITLSGQSNQTISGDSITQSGGIFLNGCSNIHITKCYIINGGATDIHLSNCSNITIDSNFVGSAQRLIYAETCPNGGIVVINNQGYNPLGPVSASGAGQFCQFDNVYTVSVQSSISNNSIQTVVGNTGGEDKINLYKSNGTQALPILVNGNKILNGSSSKTGGGILGGDSGGGWQLITNNILVNPGQYGISIAGGNNITLDGNEVYSAKFPYSNVGCYQWGQGSTIKSPTISNNRVNYTNSSGQSNGWWLGTGETPPAGLSTNNWNDPTITAGILPSDLMSWK